MPAPPEAYRARRVGDLPAEAAALWGDREAVSLGDRRWTHAEVAAEVDRVARGLIGLGVAPGDTVSVWLTNRPEFIFAMFAVARGGAIAVPLNTRYRADDVGYTVDQSDTSVLILNDRSGPIDYADILREARPGLPKLRQVVVLGPDRDPDWLGWDDLLGLGATVADDVLAARAAAVSATDPYIIIYTSGTTSRPKGAVHDHSLIRNVYERAQIHGVTADDVHAGFLPLFHAFGYTETVLFPLLTGGRVVLFETFDPAEVLDVSEREGITMLHGFDAHWGELVRVNRERPRSLAFRMGTLAAGQESTTPVAVRVQQELCPTVSAWGMSEVWTACVVGHVANTVEQRTEASGYPMVDVELRIIDPETGRDQPPDVPGELLCRSYTRMLGYYKKPVETAETIDPDGWLHTGDLARIRPDGHLVFMGRLKDMLKVGGENMAPAEVEGRLRECDGVADVAVVGLPDARLGEVPVAYVLAEPGAVLDGDALVDQLRGRVAGFKIPRHVAVVDELPMTPTGKIRKVELRDRARAHWA
ncbi:MAG: class I adenylate-forming enzyme family protein [Acidimicrobiales bacterium]